MARENRTPFVVLGILGILEGKPLSGYDIKHVIDNSVSHFWSESYGQIYPVLKQLASEKLIRAMAGGEGGRRKVLYKITAKGERMLREWLSKPPEEGPMRDELVLKLFFGSKTEVPVLIRHLQGRRDRWSAGVQQLSGWLKLVEGQKAESYTPFQLITLRGGLALCEGFVKWADESIATLNRMGSEKR